MLKGSCACGKVHYEIHGTPLDAIAYCHCWRCRKQSGSSFATTADIGRSTLKVMTGLHLMRSWQSDPGVERFFAACCGSPIYSCNRADPDTLVFHLGTLDDDPHSAATRHCASGSKAPWLTIADDLPRDDSGPAFGARD